MYRSQFLPFKKRTKRKPFYFISIPHNYDSMSFKKAGLCMCSCFKHVISWLIHGDASWVHDIWYISLPMSCWVSSKCILTKILNIEVGGHGSWHSVAMQPHTQQTATHCVLTPFCHGNLSYRSSSGWSAFITHVHQWALGPWPWHQFTGCTSLYHCW